MKEVRVRRILFRQFDKILILFSLIFLIMEGVWIPLNSFLSDFLLQQTGFFYLSYNNILQVLLKSPLICLALFALFLLNLLVVYWQMGTIFVGIHQLLDEKHQTLRQFLRATGRESLKVLKGANVSKIAFVLAYASLLFPFIRKVLKIYYLNKLLIPDFILEYLTRNPWVDLLFGLLSLVFLVLGIRFIYVLPQIFLEGKSLKEAVQVSFERTVGKFLPYAKRFLWLVFKLSVFYALVCLLVGMTQAVADTLENHWSFYVALGNFVLLKFCYYGVMVYFLMYFVASLSAWQLSASRNPQIIWQRSALVLFLASLVFASEGWLTLQFPTDELPLFISHRGVDDENGVQNTLESLELTAKEKPDYIEMDIQETEDHDFVMMHDPNLKALAGIDVVPQDLTLAELTKLTVSENGHEAKIPSFEAYFQKANELGQKLLIEIKTSPKDSPDMMKNFLDKYGKAIKEGGHQMHSLDYKVVEAVEAYDKEIPIFFILPYNTIFPQTQASGYTMEYSTLDENFMLKSFLAQKEVYDWTVNDEGTVTKSLNLGVKGMITDRLSFVKSEVTDFVENRSYVQILTLQMTDIFDFE